MTLLLFAGLALAALSGILGLRSLTFAHVRRQHTLAQIDAYGFHSGVRPSREPRRLGELTAAAAAAVGARLVHRLGAERERELRSVLDSAGFYRTSRRSSPRCRMVSTTVSRTSAEFPPDVR